MRMIGVTGFLTAALALSVLLLLSPGARAEGAGGLFAVERSEVCVVADRAPGEPTMAVEIDGKTYHVCCERCEARLKSDPSFRFSFDPITGRMVDKADAFIAVIEDGTAFYFESQETAEAFDALIRARMKQGEVY